MSGIIDTCNHSDEILDTTSGDYICTLCGLVLDRVYQASSNLKREDEYTLTDNVRYNFVAEILSKLNLPRSLSPVICSRIGEGRVKDSDICQVIYDMLIEEKIPFTLKEITSVSGVPQTKIKPPTQNSSICIIEEKKILERCCSKLGLSYKDYTLIKRSLNNEMSGFSPSTVIAAQIYKYCKRRQIKLKLKLITEVVGVSNMSVHRYLRKNASS